MDTKRWCFRNTNDACETICVEDQASARVLWKVLSSCQETRGSWIFEEPVSGRKAPDSERRAFTRHKAELRVIMVSGSEAFRTHSSDISLGGMQLRKAVPNRMLDRECRIYIASDDGRENLELECRIVGDALDSRRIEFPRIDPRSLEKLEEWVRRAPVSA